MCKSISRLQQLIEIHLNKSLFRNNNENESLWRVQESPIEGRGIFANRDIEAGEIIFIDHPILQGPRASPKVKLHCIICAETKNLKVCSKGCGLPVCSRKCEDCSLHSLECEFLLFNVKEEADLKNEICYNLFRSLTPLRGLFLNNEFRELVLSLACHFEGKLHGFEIELIKKFINLNPSEENFIRTICSVLDSNAFEMLVFKNNKPMSLRGLYPISAILNHNCVPNTTHLYNANQEMIVKSTVLIKKDTEIFTTYATLHWSTETRRHHLSRTKHFWCNCSRCSDPLEFGAALSALRCVMKACDGVLFPMEPLKETSSWKCIKCNSVINIKKIGIVQSALGSLLTTVDFSDPDQLITLIRDRLEIVVPVSNHITVELKLRVIWMIGHKEKFEWNVLPLDQLFYKEKLCKDILEIIEKLQLGKCKTRGLILNELYLCLQEITKRNLSKNNLKYNGEIRKECQKYLQEANEILKDDITAPKIL